MLLVAVGHCRTRLALHIHVLSGHMRLALSCTHFQSEGSGKNVCKVAKDDDICIEIYQPRVLVTLVPHQSATTSTAPGLLVWAE